MKKAVIVRLALAFVSVPAVLSTPAYLQERENACIAACGECPCPPPKEAPPAPAPAPITLPPIPIPSPPAATPPPEAAPFGCIHGADPDGGQGFCPAVAAKGWCVCSDSSTYGITEGDNPCPYTAPPATGPTTLPTADCSTTPDPVPHSRNPSLTIVATSSSAAPTVSGAPNGDISCPVPLKAGTFQYFTSKYVSDNIIDIMNAGKKGSYPKNFNPRSPKAGQFTWNINDCGTRQTNGETIIELPLYLDASGTEKFWSTNTDNKPGPFREYYIRSGNVATYCGAYAHKDQSSNGDFVQCS